MDIVYKIGVLLACLIIALGIRWLSNTLQADPTRGMKVLTKSEEEAAIRAAEYNALPHRFGMRDNDMTYSYCTLEQDTLHIKGASGTTRTYQISDITRLSREQKAHEHTLSPKYGSRRYTAIYTYIRIYADGADSTGFYLYDNFDGIPLSSEQRQEIFTYLVKYSALQGSRKKEMLTELLQCKEYDPIDSNDCNDRLNVNRGYSSKDASVVGRAAAGWVIGGPVGGVIGALSAVDKNNRRRK